MNSFFDMKKIVFIFLILMLGSQGVTGETWEGTDSATTSNFTNELYSKIVWDTTSSENTLFITYIYNVGEISIPQWVISGTDGVFYLYQSGEFYFDVNAMFLEKWSIELTDSVGEYYQKGDKMTGSADTTSKLFECLEKCDISWTSADDSKANSGPNIVVYKLDDVLNAHSNFNGVDGVYSDDGNFSINESGTYFLYVQGENYTISFDDIVNKISETSKSSEDQATSNQEDTRQNVSSVSEVVLNYNLFVIMAGLVIYGKYKIKKITKL